MKPSVGRMVHYSPGEGVCWAAVITAVDLGPWVNQDTNSSEIRETAVLCIMPPMQDPFHRCTFYGHAPGNWHWPERTE